MEGGDKKAEDPEKVAPAEEKKEEEEEEEEEVVFDYDYEQLKSSPEMVNVTTSDMLTLLYPHAMSRYFSLDISYVVQYSILIEVHSTDSVAPL